MRTKVAYFGGAFDPIGNHHVRIAETLAEQMETWVAPCFHHRFAKDANLTDPYQRLDMCGIACDEAGGEKFLVKVSPFEFHSNWTGSTYETIHELKKKYPDNEFYIVMGMDNANIIHLWDRGEKLIAENPCIVIKRPTCVEKVDWFRKEPHQLLEIDWPELDLSSTGIRNAIRDKKYDYAEKHLHPEVWDYIKRHNLYGFSNGDI